MPHTVSAAKRHRQSEERRLRNKARTTELKSLKKNLQRAVNDGKADEAQVIYRDLTKHLDQAASCNTIHKNAAARTKARMAKALTAKPVATKANAPKAK
jgi:small subunit ribosomal protein S20